MTEFELDEWLEFFLKKLAVPRPNHSKAILQAADKIKTQLKDWELPVEVLSFKLRPYKHLLVGLLLICLSMLHLILLFQGWGIFSVIPALLIPLSLYLEFEVPLYSISKLITKKGENIAVQFKSPKPAAELILSAHYDSKTDYFDHLQRQKIYDLLFFFIALGALIPIFVLISDYLPENWNQTVQFFAIIGSIIYLVYWVVFALAFGGFIFISEDSQSPGVVDNATAVVALMGLASRIDQMVLRQKNINLTILFTSGEEVSMQGALDYAKKRSYQEPERDWPLYCVNLELVGQPGEILVWRRYGTFMKFIEANSKLIELLDKSVKKVTGKDLIIRDKSADDALYFLTNGIPAVTIAHMGLPAMEEKGFHSISDDFSRVSYGNLKLMIDVLFQLVTDFEDFAKRNIDS